MKVLIAAFCLVVLTGAVLSAQQVINPSGPVQPVAAPSAPWLSELKDWINLFLQVGALIAAFLAQRASGKAKEAARNVVAKVEVLEEKADISVKKAEESMNKQTQTIVTTAKKITDEQTQTLTNTLNKLV